MFHGEVIHENNFALTIKFRSGMSNASFHLTNIYGPSAPAEKAGFINWLYNFDVSTFEEWMLVGSPEDRNKPGGCVNNMLLF